MVALSPIFSSFSPPVADEIFTDFLSLSTFFTVPESSLLAVAEVPVWLDEPVVADDWLEGLLVLVDDWLDGLVLADDWLDGLLVVADWLDGLLVLDDWLDGLLVLDDWLDGLAVVDDDRLEGLVLDEDWLEELCAAAVVANANPAAATPMRSAFIFPSPPLFGAHTLRSAELSENPHFAGPVPRAA